MFHAIRKIVCDNHVFGIATSTVGNCNGIIDWIAWAYLFRSALFASQNWLGAK